MFLFGAAKLSCTRLVILFLINIFVVYVVEGYIKLSM